MTGDKIALSTNAVLAHTEAEDNTRTGARAMVDWVGTLAQCQAQKLYAMNIGASDVSVRDNGNGFWTCHADFPFGFDGQVTDYGTAPSIHELQTSVGQVSLWRSPILRGLLTGANIGKLKKVVDDYQGGHYTDGTTTAAAQAEADAAAVDGTYGVALFKQVCYLGLEDYIRYLSVYRRTLTCATPAQARAAYTGVGQIWTTAEVAAFEGIDPTGWFVLDSGAQWLKSRPEVVAAFGAKTQIVYSYTECEVASAFAYAPYGSATLLLAVT